MSMSPATLSNLYPLSDITTAIGYKAFISKLRLLETERAGAELRAAAGVPDLGVLKYEPHAAAPVTVSLHEMAKAAYKRHSRNTESVKHLLSILKTGTPPAPAPSRSASPSSVEMTIHEIAEAAYKRNSRNTENVQFMLSILTHGVPPSLSRSWSNSSTTSSLGSSTSASETSESASSDYLPNCDGLNGCDLLVEEWESAEKWVDELVNDD